MTGNRSGLSEPGVLNMLIAALVVVAAGFVLLAQGAARETFQTAAHYSKADNVDARRAKFAAGHGVADPEALAAAVRYSPLANLLISVAIEESRGNPVAVGSSGEQGAWQVQACHWGVVPHDLPGQAGQAESIISTLLLQTNGNKIKALARYNGGIAPTFRSYRYAERVLKHFWELQFAVNLPSPGYHLLRQALLETSRQSLTL